MSSMRSHARSLPPLVLFSAARTACVIGAATMLMCTAAHAQTAASSPEGTGFLDGLRKIGNAVSEAGGKIATDVAAGVKGASEGKGNVRGYVPLQNNQTLTCFEHMPGGLISTGGPISNPSQGKAAPIMVMTAKGEVVTGECDKLAAQNILVPWLPPSTGSPGSGTPVRGNSSDGPPVPVFTYKDADGNIISNAPDNCKIIHVSDSNGNLIKRRYVTRPEDYVIASKCDTARYDAISKAAKPQAAANSK